jgi:hypothetical protein
MSLIRLIPGGDVQSSTLNDNFDYLEGLISSSVSTLDGKVNSTTGNIANITSNMATIQTNLTNVTNTANSKAKKDLSDATPSATFKASVIDWLAPNYSAGYSISSGWTAPKAGWLYPYHYNTADNQELVVTIDGVEVFRTGDAGTWSTGHGASGFIFVRKGKKVAFSGSGTNTVKFCPCVGN